MLSGDEYLRGSGVWIRGGSLTLPDMDKPVEGDITISDGKIEEISIGKKAPISSTRGYDIVDASGKIVAPAFVDGHMHFTQWSISRIAVDLSGCRSWREILKLMDSHKYPDDRKSLRSITGILMGVDYDDTYFRGKEPPTLEQMDRFFGDIPTVIRRVCGHRAIGNTSFLDKVEAPEVCFENGLLTDGKGIEMAWDTPIRIDSLSECLSEGIRSLNGMGVVGGVDIIREGQLKNFLEAYEAAGSGMRLALSVIEDNMEIESPFGSLDNGKPGVGFGKKPPVVFSKLFLDGSIGAGTAAMYGGRKDEEIKKLLHDRNSLKKIVDGIHGRGLIPMMHAIGGRAVDLSIKSISSGKKPSRIEHAIEIGERSLNEAKRKGVNFCMQPNFARRWGGPGGMYEKAVGRTFKRLNKIRTVVKMGVPLCFGTDMMPPDPLYALEGAVNNPIISESLSLSEAIRCYTTNSANLSLIGDGNDFSLRVGGNGDIVVFGGDKMYSTVVHGRIINNGQCPKY